MPYLIEKKTQPRISLIKIFESLGIQILIDTKGVYLGVKDYSAVFMRDKRMYIVLRHGLPVEVARLSLMHELAHIILGHLLEGCTVSSERREFEAESLGYLLYSYVDNPFYSEQICSSSNSLNISESVSGAGRIKIHRCAAEEGTHCNS